MFGSWIRALWLAVLRSKFSAQVAVQSAKKDAIFII